MKKIVEEVIEEEPQKITNFDTLKIGIDKPIQPKEVRVLGYEFVTISKEGKSIQKLVLVCQHPDFKKETKISKVKFERGKTLKESGLWLEIDEDGNIPSKSAIAFLLKNYGCRNLKDIVNKNLNTALDSNGFLMIKCY